MGDDSQGCKNDSISQGGKGNQKTISTLLRGAGNRNQTLLEVKKAKITNYFCNVKQDN